MKGILFKKGNEWFVRQEGPFTFCELPLHPDDVENVQRFNELVFNLDKNEVFFDAVTKYIEPDESIHCNRGVDKKFAKLISWEERKKEKLAEIIKEAQEMGLYEEDFYTKISQVERLALEKFKKVGDEGLFPNHTDKDIWIDGFKSGFESGDCDDNNKVIDNKIEKSWDDVYEKCKKITDSPSMTRAVIRWLDESYYPPTKKHSAKVGGDEKSDLFWDDNKVIDFVNWFLKLKKLPFNYTLENREIIDSFKRGDDFSLWHDKKE